MWQRPAALLTTSLSRCHGSELIQKDDKTNITRGRGCGGSAYVMVGLSKFSQFEWMVHPVVWLTDPPVCQPPTPVCRDRVLHSWTAQRWHWTFFFVPDSAIACMEMLCTISSFRIKLLKQTSPTLARLITLWNFNFSSCRIGYILWDSGLSLLSY